MPPIHTDEPIKNQKKKIAIAVGLGLLAVIMFVGLLFKIFYQGPLLKGIITDVDQEFVVGDPVDVVLDFYNPWLEAVRATGTDPYVSGFATKKILSAALRTRLASTEGDADTEIDPVLCQTTVPERITGRIVSKQENEARVLVMAKDKELTAQSVFTLKRQNDGWFIDSILCSPGEFDIPREFSFEREGYLLKSVPPPLDPQYWHIVFEQNGELGHTVPLLFDAESSCITADKVTTICAPDQLKDAVKIHVYGQALETGITVKRLEFLE